jgi:hypothetical protein
VWFRRNAFGTISYLKPIHSEAMGHPDHRISANVIARMHPVFLGMRRGNLISYINDPLQSGGAPGLMIVGVEGDPDYGGF